MHPSWAGAKHPFLVNLGALPAGIGLRFTSFGHESVNPLVFLLPSKGGMLQGRLLCACCFA